MLQESESLRGFFFFAETSESELAAFTSYALSFPTKFQALVDTMLKSPLHHPLSNYRIGGHIVKKKLE